MNQGYLFRRVTANRSQNLHKSDEALVMSVEQREAGRWMSKGHADGKKPTPVENTPKQVGRSLAHEKVELGGTHGMDGAHADSPWQRGERGQMV